MFFKAAMLISFENVLLLVDQFFRATKASLLESNPLKGCWISVNKDVDYDFLWFFSSNQEAIIRADIRGISLLEGKAV